MEAKKLRLVYMGTPDFAVSPLAKLVEEGYNVVGVVTMPDKPSGRGLHVQQSAVKRYALQAGLPVYQPEKLRDPAFVETFRSMKPDLGIVIAFRMLPEIIWAAPKLGTFNLHASLLPQYRGAAPINWALINGETETGVTTFLLNREIDKGAVLCQTRVPIGPDDDAGTLHDRLMEAGTELVVETIGKIAQGTVTAVEQPTVDPECLKGAPKIFKETCRIDWRQPAARICNLIRGLSPYPAAWSELSRPDATPVGVKIFRAKAEACRPGKAPGAIVTDGRSEIKVACADGYVQIEELQIAGRRRMTTEELLRGFKEIESCTFR